MPAQAPIASRQWADPVAQVLQLRLDAVVARGLPYRARLVGGGGIYAVELWNGDFRVATQHADSFLTAMEGM